MNIYYIAIDKKDNTPAINLLNVQALESVLYLTNTEDIVKLNINSVILNNEIYVDQSKKIIFSSNAKTASDLKKDWSILYMKFKDIYINKFLNSPESLFLTRRSFNHYKKKMQNYCITESFNELLKQKRLI